MELRETRQRQGQILRTIRLALGMTLYEVAEKHALRVRLAYLSDLENGRAPMAVDAVKNMARVYGLDAARLAYVLLLANKSPDRSRS